MIYQHGKMALVRLRNRMQRWTLLYRSHMELKEKIRTTLQWSRSKFHKKHGVKRLVYTEEPFDIIEARAREKQIKDWSRKKKELLIEGVLSPL